MIDILIADDQTLMREGLQTILSLEEDMVVVGMAENGSQALEQAERLKPHVVLLDIQMPVMDGIECVRRLKASQPDTVVLILTTFAEDEYIIEALTCGATGFLLKDMPGDKLIQSIRDAVSGQLIMPSVIAAKLAARLSKLSSTTRIQMDAARLKAEGVTFTERERSIILLMLQGMSNRQIAGILYMSEGTVKNYVSAIYNKIGTNDRTKAIIALKEIFPDAD